MSCQSNPIDDLFRFQPMDDEKKIPQIPVKRFQVRHLSKSNLPIDKKECNPREQTEVSGLKASFHPIGFFYMDEICRVWLVSGCAIFFSLLPWHFRTPAVVGPREIGSGEDEGGTYFMRRC
jgi:hypothetical protein